MPAGNKTGPEGLGPATGRGLGGCEPTSYIVSTPIGRRGYGYGRFGYYGIGYPPTELLQPTISQEHLLAHLELQITEMKETLEILEEQIAAIKENQGKQNEDNKPKTTK